MNGYTYGDAPVERCPYCGSVCEADWVDVGVEYEQCGPFHCIDCGAIQIGPYDKEVELLDEEKRTHWYAPNRPYSGSGNMVGGRLVSHEVALQVYKDNYPFSATEEGREYIRDIGDPKDFRTKGF